VVQALLAGYAAQPQMTEELRRLPVDVHLIATRCSARCVDVNQRIGNGINRD
jgi:hypothetical protein